MSEFFRELLAIKLLELAMFIAPTEMELAIAKGISLTFTELMKDLMKQGKIKDTNPNPEPRREGEE